MSSPVKEPVEAILGRFERYAAEARERRNALEAWAAGQPQSKACEKHPHIVRKIDFDKSSTLTEKSETGCLIFKLAYSPCPECKKEIRLANESHWLSLCGVPENLLHGSFSTFRIESKEDEDNLHTAKRFVDKGKGFLIMLGNKGDGKSLLAVAALRHFGGGRFEEHNKMLEKLRRTYRDRKAEDIVIACERARCFVLDDFGLSAGGADELPMLHGVLDYRYGEKIPTIITSNLTREKLNESIGARMADRLDECTFAVLNFNGPSSRKFERNKYFA